MALAIDQVVAEVIEPSVPEPQAPLNAGRPPPDMARIQAELRREAERHQRLWTD